MRSRRLAGFTLLEVMVALVIFSLALAGVAVSLGQMIV
jgi:prepilin-type N-terminal cleavage/methylation domain-containing protein